MTESWFKLKLIFELWIYSMYIGPCINGSWWALLLSMMAHFGGKKCIKSFEMSDLDITVFALG